MTAAQDKKGRAFTGSPYLHELNLRLKADAPTPIPLANLTAFVKRALGPAAGSALGKSMLDALSYYKQLAEIYGGLFPDATIASLPEGETPDPSLPSTFVEQLPDKPVVLSVLDEGLPFLHQKTVNEGLSRFASIWMQDARPGPGDTAHLPIGRGLDHAEIQNLLDQQMHEITAYRACGAIDHTLPTQQRLLQRSTHGSAVLGLAVGKVSDKHLLMGVNFPPAAVKDTSGTLLPFFVLLGICYCLEQTQRLARQLEAAAPDRFCDVEIPLVFNLSYGVLAGPKDGSGILEAVMEKLSNISPGDLPGIKAIRFVLPMGNGRQSQTAGRLEGDLSSVTLRLVPDDKTPSFVEIWTDASDTADTKTCPELMTVTSPHTNEDVIVPSIRFGTYEVLSFECGTQVRVYADQRLHDGKRRNLLLLAFPPTVGLPPAELARAGDWSLNTISEVPQPIDVFVQRDEGLFGLDSGGRQSRLSHRKYRRFSAEGRWIMEDDPSLRCPVTRRGTVTAFANGTSIVRVGAELERSGDLSSYSAKAFPQGARPPDGDQVRAVDESYNNPGMRVDGTTTGSIARLSGTSFAAPMVAADISRSYGASD